MQCPTGICGKKACKAINHKLLVVNLPNDANVDVTAKQLSIGLEDYGHTLAHLAPGETVAITFTGLEPNATR